jgi:2-methylisocitrate lyase-like PEP mutase family enzyme
LILPNAWDALTARLVEQAGAQAVATTSAGVAWSLGYADGQRAPWAEVIAGLGHMARAVTVPVSADLEGGYVDATGGIDRTVAALVQAGVAGFGLEDTDFRPGAQGVVEAEAHAELVAAARAAADAAGVPLFINGRTELYVRNVGADDARVEEAARRLALYLEAGADGAFCPGIRDPADIEALARRLAGPLNVLWVPGMPSLDELERLGVRRVTFGSRPYLAALAAVERVADGLTRRDLTPLTELGVPAPETMRRIAAPGADGQQRASSPSPRGRSDQAASTTRTRRSRARPRGPRGDETEPPRSRRAGGGKLGLARGQTSV